MVHIVFAKGPCNYLSCCSSGHLFNVLLGYPSGLNVAAELGPFLALLKKGRICLSEVRSPDQMYVQRC